MTTNTRGTLPLKRKFRGLPLIRRASGTHDPAQLKRLHRMLHVLHEQQRADILEAIAAGRLIPMVVYNRFQQQRLHELPMADLLPPLLKRFAAWIESDTDSDETARSRWNAHAILERYATADTDLTHLPAIVGRYRSESRAHGRAFNLFRSCVQAFCRDVLTKRHPVYHAVSDVTPRKTKPKRDPKPFSVGGLYALIKGGGPHAMAAWSMATHGMGPKEFFEDGFDILVDRVAIHGQKRDRRERVVPRVSMIEQPERGRVQFQRWFRKRATGHQPYDLRRTYANLMVDAGIPVNRRDMYQGHAPKTMTQLYEQPQIAAWLLEDGAALRKVLDLPEPGLRLVKGA